MTQPQYSIIPPTAPLTDGKGNITRVWWRFLSSLFQTGGSGQSPTNLSELAAEVEALENEQAELAEEVASLENVQGLQGLAGGPDYSSSLRALETQIALIPSPASRISDLERRVTVLEIAAAAAANPSARIQALERRLADLQALLTTYPMR